MGSGLEGFDFSHERVKRVVGLLMGFVSVIASAPYLFLYLKQGIHDIKKEKKKKKREKQYFISFFIFLIRSTSSD